MQNELNSKDTSETSSAEVDSFTEKEMDRTARKELDKRTRKKRRAIAEFVKHCGELKDRPFEDTRWHFESFLRAFVQDSLIYDQAAIELIPKDAAKVDDRLNLHHFRPVDGSTIRFASPELKKYKDRDMSNGFDILYPEEELEALEERDALELDDDRLEENAYKYVQLVKGRIQRAFTADELALGMRNPTTDIYSNGYPIPELELVMSLVSSHLHTEFYNKAYFQQGFSAKGILHIKANLNRSKLEALRRHWTHMVKGGRNSFQTPIMSGMEEIQWIPLTQNHSEMEFSLWLNYLIKMICAIYLIDPAEIGYGMREEGGRSGGGLSGGDNTEAKLKASQDKGFVPLMRFIERFLNTSVVDKLDPDYEFRWVGLTEENSRELIERQEKEIKFKKTVNEIREEDGLPAIAGADELILDPVYFQWWTQFSEEGQRFMEQQQQQMAANEKVAPEEEVSEEEVKQSDHERELELREVDHENAKDLEEHKANLNKDSDSKDTQEVKKSIKIEYFDD